MRDWGDLQPELSAGPEKAYECKESDYILRRFDFSAVNIDDITEGLEGIETYAYRKYDIQRRYVQFCSEKCEQPVDAVYEEIGIFEETEYSEIDYEAEGQQRFSPCLIILTCIPDGPSEKIIDRGTEYEETEETPVPHPVEKIATY